MKDIFDLLFGELGPPATVAKALGYTNRQYLNLRRKVARGEKLHPRVEIFILVKAQMLAGNSFTFLPHLVPAAWALAPVSVERQAHGT